MIEVGITGAASGIGKALAEHYLKLGAKVHAIDLNLSGLQALQVEADKKGQLLSIYESDLSKTKSWAPLFDSVVENSKGLDIWVNCAGVAGLGGFADLSEEEFETVVDINLRAVVSLTRLALRYMEARGSGTIVNIASVAGFVAAPMASAYVATKHAVVGFSRSLRQELEIKESPVKILLVAPGFVETPILNRGAAIGFPEFGNFMVESPESVARQIARAVEREVAEIVPTLNGKVMKLMGTLAPGVLKAASRLAVKG